eukprot:TRINITY_DN14117_c0_g4_i1.p1 TRINITY_DN14117_c0_g4~~TRINITY_DN14117_c0_g4_i1.p1  ORF type:complete len:328 (-),score=46.73 TRINITY_DN14117_c0_g4_i1:462-1322(-)
MAEGEIFDGDFDYVAAWVRNHVEVLQPKVVVSLGPSAPLVDRVFDEVAVSLKPQWHLKCFQTACPMDRFGSSAKETCMHFEPTAVSVLKTIGRAKPSVKKIIFLSDGSSFATKLGSSLQVLPADVRELHCGGLGAVLVPCDIEIVQVRSANDIGDALSSKVHGVALPEELFVLLPSIVGISSAASSIWEELRPNRVGEMVPKELVSMGALMAIHAHPGGSAEDCSYVIAQKATLHKVDEYSVEVSDSLGILFNSGRFASVSGLNAFSGELEDNGRNKWNPVRILWP